jgi:hypothetical protein
MKDIGALRAPGFSSRHVDHRRLRVICSLERDMGLR